MSSSVAQRILGELGLISVIKSPPDVKLLCLQRFVRLFAFGAAALILALYLEQLGYSDRLTGLFMTLTMLGDVLISFCLTLFADRIGRKNVLVAGAALVCLSGVVFAMASNFWVLLAAAILGVVSPSGNEIGPFRAIEESILSSLAPSDVPNSKSDVFAWYMLTGTLGAALGSGASGGIVHLLMHNHHYTILESYRWLFWLYAVLGVIKLTFAVCLSSRIELSGNEKEHNLVDDAVSSPTERQPLLAPTSESIGQRISNGKPNSTPVATSRSHPPDVATTPARSTLIPHISAASRKHLYKLIPLFAIDNFASGLVPLSWLSPFFHDKYNLSHSALGSLFFAAALVGAFSNLVSASIARRSGLVYTMVLTHLPSNIFLSLIPVPGPSMVWLAVLLLVLRSATSTMDTGPRQAFLATLLDPSERTAVMGFVNVVKTIAQSIGPYASGVLKSEGLLWVSFVLAGCLKASYDLGLLVSFWSWRGVVEGREEKHAPAESDEHGHRRQAGNDEEHGTGDRRGEVQSGLIQMVDEEASASGSRSASR